MQLTQQIIQLTKDFKTPFLFIDLTRIRQNYRRIKKSIKDVEVFYAIKANDHPVILQCLHKEGSSFEISSLNEMKELLKMGVNSSKIMCFNSIKSPEFLHAMEKKGIRYMAYDSTDEVDKIARFSPSAKLVLRVNVPNEGSDWPLTKKFGVDLVDALDLLLYAKSKGLNPAGITFHVGSQCLNRNNWANALYLCNDIWKAASANGIDLHLISLGGGIPVQHIKPIPTINEIGDLINKSIKKNFYVKKGKLKISIEPGRGLVGDAGILGTTVVGKAKRGNENWVYIDAGTFNGLMETIEKFTYELKTEHDGKAKRVTIAGPSCDSVDIPFVNIKLPEVKIGDRVYIINAAAYTTVYAAPFNGFDVPAIRFINE